MIDRYYQYRGALRKVITVDEKHNWPHTMLEIEFKTRKGTQYRIVRQSRPYIEVPIEKWTLFCKRTEDPKLAWIERELDKLGITHKREGASFHASNILWVDTNRLEEADAILQRKVGRYTIDDIRDDHPRWEL